MWIRNSPPEWIGGLSGEPLGHKALAVDEEDCVLKDAAKKEPSLIHDFLIRNITVNTIRKNLD